MLRPALLFAGVLSVLGLAVAGGAATAASNCDTEGKEGSGCTLPKSTSYRVTKSVDDAWNLTQSRGKAQLRFRNVCAHQRRGRLKIKGSLKVGKTYTFKQTKKVPAGRVLITYTVKLTAKIVSATKATVKGTVNAYEPPIPPSGTRPGVDEERLACNVNRRLKRATSD
jgi:hypothetical protein